MNEVLDLRRLGPHKYVLGAFLLASTKGLPAEDENGATATGIVAADPISVVVNTWVTFVEEFIRLLLVYITGTGA